MTTGFGQNVIQVVIRAKDEFSRALTKAQTGLQSFKKAALGMGIVGGVIGLGLKDATSAAVDAQETFSKFEVVFKDVGKASEVVAKDLRDNYGLASSTSKKLLSDTGDLLTGFGFTADEALNMSEKVNKLAVDLASFTNIEGGAERASRALTKGMIGEREMMKELGIAITENELARFAESKGITKSIKEMSKQEKAILTLDLAVSQSKNAIGDYARTQDQAANQIRLTQERFKELKEEIGAAFVPMIETLMPIVQGLLKWFMNLPGPAKEAISIFAALSAVFLLVGAAIAFTSLAAAGWIAVILLLAAAVTGIIFVIKKLKANWIEFIVGLSKAFMNFDIFMTKFLFGVKEIWIKVWGSIKNFFFNIWNGIVSGFQGYVNAIISTVNFLIRGVNKISSALGLGSIGEIGKVDFSQAKAELVDINKLVQEIEAEKTARIFNIKQGHAEVITNANRIRAAEQQAAQINITNNIEGSVLSEDQLTDTISTTLSNQLGNKVSM